MMITQGVLILRLNNDDNAGCTHIEVKQ
jgi:hypothetical protein